MLYDDDIAREAVANVAPLFDGKTYVLIGNNCQTFADAVRAEIRRLQKERGAENGN